MNRYIEKAVDIITKPLTSRKIPLYTAPPEPVKKEEPKKKKVLRYKDWSQADQMKYKLDKNSAKGRYSDGIGVGP